MKIEITVNEKKHLQTVVVDGVKVFDAERDNKNGETRRANEITRFLPPPEPKAAPAPAWQQGQF